MSGPSQAQTGLGSFLKNFLLGGAKASDEAQAGEEKKAAQGQYFNAMSALKDKELGAKREEDMMEPDEATRLATEGKVPFHFEKPIHRGTFSDLMTNWAATHKPKDLGDKTPHFDMGTAQTQALAAARAQMGKEFQGMPYADLPPNVAQDFNTAYKLHLGNNILTFEKLNGSRTGVKASDYIQPGVAGNWLGGHSFGKLGTQHVPNKLLSGYEQEAAGGGGGKPLDDAAFKRIREVRVSHPTMTPDQMVDALAQVGYKTNAAELAGVK